MISDNFFCVLYLLEQKQIAGREQQPVLGEGEGDITVDDGYHHRLSVTQIADVTADCFGRVAKGLVGGNGDRCHRTLLPAKLPDIIFNMLMQKVNILIGI